MLLDTNVYSALAGGVQSAVDAVRDAPEIKLPLPVIAELRYGFLKGAKKDQNELTLRKFLAQPNITIVAPTFETTAEYAELQFYCSRRGKALSHNDIWIAALAKQTKDILITFDRDFSVFSDLLGNRLLLL